MATLTSPLVDALYRIDGKAEIIEGKIVHQMATGRKPAYAAGEVFFYLRLHVRENNLTGIAVPDNAGFLVNLPNRSSFSPDAAYYIGPNSGMRFFEGAPAFAVEVRSENDYGVTAEAEMAAKRRDYFAAGSLVVWDVDLLSETEIVRKYTAESGTDRPAATFQRGETADAEPAVPGWTMPINDLFEE
jgi:Uma2 family endonuclease